MLFALASCGGSSVERAIRDAFVEGDTTRARYDSIVSLVERGGDRGLVDEQGNVDREALQRLVNEIGGKLRPPMTWNVLQYGDAGRLSLTVYFERSGSMIPYDSKRGGGRLKKAVNDFINFFPGGGTTTISIVNDNIYPYDGSVDEFLQDRDIYASTQGVGDASFTDFRLIFDKILKAQTKDNISILVTDLIYSPRDTHDLSVDKIFNELNSLATAIFKRYPSRSVIVYKMEGDYDGKYYPYNQAAVDYHGSRPYYVLLIGEIAVLDRMARDKAFDRFLHPSGAVASYRFNQGSGDLQWAPLLNAEGEAGRYRPSRDATSTLDHCEGDRTTGILAFTVAVDLSGLGKDAAFLSDAANYSVTSQSGFTLAVREITSADINNNNRSTLEGKTHLLTFSAKWNTASDDITVTLRNDFPTWIATSSSSDDRDTHSPSFASTTFGLDRFLHGLADAYPHADYARLVIHLKK